MRKSVHRNHDIGGFDDGISNLAWRQVQIFCGFLRDDGDNFDGIREFQNYLGVDSAGNDFFSLCISRDCGHSVSLSASVS